mgnify:CR=1 FL=1
MTILLPLEPLFILYTLRQSGYEAYVVGGAVRDLLIQAKDNASLEEVPVTDFDFTTNATPEQVQAVFPDSFYENQFGTVSVTKEHLWEMAGFDHEVLKKISPEKSKDLRPKLINLREATKIHVSLQTASSDEHVVHHFRNYEITTYRADGKYQDHRRPEAVTWGRSLQDDLSRRDFTINAMAIEVSKNFLHQLFSPDALKKLTVNPLQLMSVSPDNYSIIDPFDGLADLANKIIKPVGEPTQRFQEDALRMLRAIRFSVQLNMEMTEETFAAISDLRQDIQHVSWERIRDEFLKMLTSNYPAESVELLDATGLLEFLLPELLEGKGVEQGGHHTTDVWTHSLDAVSNCPSPDPVVRFATLLHDVAKPRTFKILNGQPTFYNHEIIGARVAKQIAQRFRLSHHDIDRMFILVRYHMFYYQPENTDASIRRFMRKVDLENIDDILDLREADRLGSGARKTSWRLEEMKQRMIEQLHQPFDVTDMEIDGTQLMEELKLPPGRVIGQLLHHLFELVMENPELNTKEQLLDKAQKALSQLEEGNS